MFILLLLLLLKYNPKYITMRNLYSHTHKYTRHHHRRHYGCWCCFCYIADNIIIRLIIKFSYILWLHTFSCTIFKCLKLKHTHTIRQWLVRCKKDKNNISSFCSNCIPWIFHWHDSWARICHTKTLLNNAKKAVFKHFKQIYTCVCVWISKKYRVWMKW